MTCPLRTTAMPTEQNSHVQRNPAEMGLCAWEPQGAQSSGCGVKTKPCFIGPGIKHPGTHSFLPEIPGVYWITQLGTKAFYDLLRRLNFQVFNKISGKTVLLSKGQAMLEANLKKKKKKKKTISTSSNYLELCMFTAIYDWQKVARLSSSWLG